MRKTVAVFGSTGSIGKSSIDILLKNIDSYEVVALVAHENYLLLIEQAKQIKPKYVVIGNEKFELEIRDGLKDFPDIEILSGLKSICEVAKIKCDIFISAIVGMAALEPTMNAIKAGSNIGLANKECLVSAGDIMIAQAKENAVKLIPIDSEHNAIFQVFEKENLDLIENITLTASGGPFYKMKLEELENVTKEQAIKHPNWSMGAKISVDSATMMNKALEFIEAYRLFNIAIDKINVVIHPQSIIHGMVDYKDGSTLSMMSIPDMRVPISYALSYPRRMKIAYERLDLAKISALDFFAVDEERFLAIKLAKDALKIGGNAPCILNAANEVSVQRFLKDEISFNDILKINMEVLEKISYGDINSLQDVLQFDKEARILAQSIN